MPTRSSAASWRRRSACRSRSAAGDVRALAEESGRSVEDAAREARYGFLTGALPSIDAHGDRRRPQPRRSGRDVPAAADSRRRAGRPVGGAAARRTRDQAAARHFPRRPPRLRRRARAAVARGFLEHRPRHPAQPGAPRAPAASRAVLAVDCRHSGAQRGARQGGRRISRGGCNRIGPVRSSYRKTTASSSTPRRWRPFTPLWPARVARTALQAAAPGRFIGFQHVDDLLDAHPAGRRGGGRLAGAGGDASGEPDRCWAGLYRRRSVNSFNVPLSIPGEVEAAGWKVTAELHRRPPSADGGRAACRGGGRRAARARRWRSGTAGPAIDSNRSAIPDGAKAAGLCWSTGRCRERNGMACPS